MQCKLLFSIVIAFCENGHEFRIYRLGAERMELGYL